MTQISCTICQRIRILVLTRIGTNTMSFAITIVILMVQNCQIYEAWTLAFLFNFLFLFLFFILGSRVRIRLMSQSYCHTSVTLDDTVIVMVTQSHRHMEYSKQFKNNNILQYIQYMLTLWLTHGLQGRLEIAKNRPSIVSIQVDILY